MKTITYVVVNKELKMSAGKAMAQVAHAIMLAASPEDLENYSESARRTIIVLEATGQQIMNLYGFLGERGVDCDYVVDEGANEIPTMSITALATECFDIEDRDKRDYFSGFKLYKHRLFGK